MATLACPSEQELLAFHLGQLNEEALEVVAGHLETCPACAQAIHHLDSRLDPFLASLRQAAPPQETPSEDQQESAEVGRECSQRIDRRRVWLRAALAASIIAVAVLAFWARPDKFRRSQVDWPEPPPGSVFLADLRPVEIENWPFEPPVPAGEEVSLIRVGGRVSPHGIFMHPPPPSERQAASLTYRLDRRYRRFQSAVTLRDGPNRSAVPITFTVLGDGKELWQSAPVESQADSQAVDLDVAEIDLLKIEVESPPGRHVYGAFAVWIEPCLTPR